MGTICFYSVFSDLLATQAEIVEDEAFNRAGQSKSILSSVALAFGGTGNGGLVHMRGQFFL